MASVTCIHCRVDLLSRAHERGCLSILGPALDLNAIVEEILRAERLDG